MFFCVAALTMGLATTMTDDNACQGLERLDFKVRIIYRQAFVASLTICAAEFLIPLLSLGLNTEWHWAQELNMSSAKKLVFEVPLQPCSHDLLLLTFYSITTHYRDPPLCCISPMVPRLRVIRLEPRLQCRAKSSSTLVWSDIPKRLRILLIEVKFWS
jgi:hypothetical protein